MGLQPRNVTASWSLAHLNFAVGRGRPSLAWGAQSLSDTSDTTPQAEDEKHRPSCEENGTLPPDPDDSEFRPVKIKGELLSETIMRDRR